MRIDQARFSSTNQAYISPTDLNTLTVSDDKNYCPPVVRNSVSELLISLLVVLVSSAYLSLIYDYSNLIDEGIILQGAERLLHGQVLYRDFFAFYTPGSYYLTALCFKLFGSSFLVARARLVLFGGLFSLLTFSIARRTCSLWTSLSVVYIVLLCLPYCFYVQHNWDSTMLAFLALYCLVRFIESPSRITALGLGAFCALTFLFEQSKGAGLVAGICLGIACGLLLRWRLPALNKRYALATIFGFVVPVLVTLGYFALHQALGIALSDWVWPLHHYSEINVVPYGHFPLRSSTHALLASGSWLGRFLKYMVIAPAFMIPFLPTLSIAFLYLHANRTALRGIVSQRDAYFTLVGCALLGVWLSLLLTRGDLAHCIFVLPLFSLPLAWMIDVNDTTRRWLRRLMPITTAFVLLSFSLFGLVLLYHSRAGQTQATRRGKVRFSSYDEIVPYVIAHVAAGDNIFVYPYQPLYYYLTATNNPTKFEYLQAGLHTSEQVQEIVKELANSTPRAILVWPDFQREMMLSFPRTSRAGFASLEPVSDYISSHYHQCKNLHSGPVDYWFMLRNDIECGK